MTNYSLSDFNRIGYDGFQITLPDEVIIEINELVRKVGAPNYIRTPVFQKIGKNDIGGTYNKKKKDRDREKERVQIQNHEEWERIKKFQVTKVEEKSEIETCVSSIRSFLNKLTDKNSSDVTGNIMAILKKIDTHEDQEVKTANFNKIGNILFEIASTNIFFSRVYADVYASLCSEYECFYALVESNYELYIESFSNIEDTSPEKDYNSFCRVTKLNDNRRALSSFYLNLYCSGVFPFEKIQYIVVFLMNQINDSVLNKEQSYIVDEYTENIAILYSQDMEYSHNIKLNNNKSILETITFYANSKTNGTSFSGLSAKCTFKYMDIIGI
jgi:hypothetical protein